VKIGLYLSNQHHLQTGMVAALEVISRSNIVFSSGLGYRGVGFHAFGLERRSRAQHHCGNPPVL
jgi:hypothetical protein